MAEFLYSQDLILFAQIMFDKQAYSVLLQLQTDHTESLTYIIYFVISALF